MIEKLMNIICKNIFVWGLFGILSTLLILYVTGIMYI